MTYRNRTCRNKAAGHVLFRIWQQYVVSAFKWIPCINNSYFKAQTQKT